jgi:hypothetical protein
VHGANGREPIGIVHRAVHKRAEDLVEEATAMVLD